jgi:hypothetical protein
VFDESGSVDRDSFQREKQFGIDFADTFTFGENAAKMALVQFDTVSRLTIVMQNNKNNFINLMNSITQNGRATCIGCGIQTAQQELNAKKRAQASQTMVVLTDGQNNVNVQSFPGILANAKASGTIMVAIGVARAVEAEIRNIASSPNLAFFAADFRALNGILDGLAVQTCDDIAGNLCGAGCKGFCACNQQCLCPDVCENQDKCVQPTCNVNQNGAGCQFPRNVVCNDGNACTTDSCNSQLGCVTAPVVCNDAKKCTTDSCDPNVGCVFLNVDCTPNPPDPCNNFSCSETGPGNGCVSIPNPCNLCLVNNVTCPKINCKINVCNPNNGLCAATDKVCNSNNKCIIDSCNPANDQCVQTALVCNDNNACTDDSCNPATGCVFTPFDPAVRCDDSSVCTTDTCVPATGCVNTPITCNRTDICKDAICNSVLGCQEADVDCGSVLSVIDPNKQGNCYIAACAADRPNPANQGKDGCFLSQLPGTSVDRCGFCAAPGAQSPFCLLGLDAGSAAGLGGGVIAAIVIGAVVAAVVAVVSGKKGYDVWVKHRNNMQGAQANPMYEDSGRSGNNPFFEAKA